MISFAYKEEGPLWMGLQVICHKGPVHMKDGSEIRPRLASRSATAASALFMDTMPVILLTVSDEEYGKVLKREEKYNVLVFDDSQTPWKMLRNDFSKPIFRNYWPDASAHGEMFWAHFTRDGHKLPQHYISVEGDICSQDGTVIMPGPK